MAIVLVCGPLTRCAQNGLTAAPRAKQHAPCYLPLVIGFAAVLTSPAATVSEGYCCQRLPISGAGRQGTPYHRPPRLSLWPYTVSVANSFRCSFVWVLWPDHQPRSAVAAKPLSDSTASDHDSPNAPATARSVYVIAHPAARRRRRSSRLRWKNCLGSWTVKQAQKLIRASFATCHSKPSELTLHP